MLPRFSRGAAVVADLNRKAASSSAISGNMPMKRPLSCQGCFARPRRPFGSTGISSIIVPSQVILHDTRL